MTTERDDVLHSWCVQADWNAPTIVGGAGWKEIVLAVVGAINIFIRTQTDQPIAFKKQPAQPKQLKQDEQSREDLQPTQTIRLEKKD